MSKIKKFPDPADPAKYQLHFFCPACQDTHAVNQSWTFNEDYENPSLEPSIRVQGVNDNGPFECHTWMTKGRLKYFSDCTHNMAGQQWIDIPEFPNEPKYND